MAKRTKKKGTTEATETKTEWTRESTREVAAFDARSFMESATAFERNPTREFELPEWVDELWEESEVHVAADDVFAEVAVA